jgi:hypothetical protein
MGLPSNARWTEKNGPVVESHDETEDAFAWVIVTVVFWLVAQEMNLGLAGGSVFVRVPVVDLTQPRNWYRAIELFGGRYILALEPVTRGTARRHPVGWARKDRHTPNGCKCQTLPFVEVRPARGCIHKHPT